MELLAKRLKWLRERERYSQKEIAEKIGMSPPGYQKIEYGDREPKLDVLIKFCEIYEVSADFLLGREDSIFILEELLRNILAAERVLEHTEEEKRKTQDQMFEVQSDILFIAKSEGFESENVKEKQIYLNTLEKQMFKYDLETRMYDKHFRESISKYISLILTIPGTNIKEDKIIDKYSPFSFEVSGLDKEYNILLISSKVKGYIGGLDTCKSPQEADELINQYNKKLYSFEEV
ncbi:helix-turn-helix domain-containing protein [Niallia taxi]|uniref:helix-turn-helix domain-containing protein n=1 Tax=Niallia taxi TaxID=2499688 RepID=UPI00300B9A61